MVVEWFWNLMVTIRGNFLFTIEKSPLHLTKTKPLNQEGKPNLRDTFLISCGEFIELRESSQLYG
ncbi:hypothetical protein CH359_07955 [Leptospira meyeri]|nr:hypothetical protein CH359_07955 [Leptospira meyeri]PJZ96522.1 hypothetical protein CH358_09625 [Leptospira meyeri]